MASFPYMARLIAENKLAEMNRLLNNTLRVLAIVIPFSVLLMVLRQEVVVILFQRGRFDAAATALTSQVLVFLLIGAFAFAAQTVVVRGYYAMQNTFFPAVFNTLAVLLSIPLYLYGMHRMGVNGIALAISLSAIFQVTLMYALWNKRSENRESRGVYGFFLKMFLLSLPVGAALEWFRILIAGSLDAATFAGSFIITAATGTLFMAIFVTAGYVLHIREIVELMNGVFDRMRGGIHS
jgi:putative peptidoglycan lipid II flippase